MIGLRGGATVSALLALVMLLPTVVATAQTEPAEQTEPPAANGLVDVSVRPGVVLIDGSGARARRVPGRATIAVRLAETADLRVRVTDFDGRLVRELIDARHDAGTIERRWNGRDDDGRPVPLGPYFVVATADAGSGRERVSVPVAVADTKVYPRRPDFITVVLDAGHGGPRSGAKGASGTREADINLDISLRAAAMLEAAGVNVILTRTTDAAVNEPTIDRTRDGVADDTDELAARNDIANLARADLFIAVHNNSAVNTAVGGPSTFFSDERSYQGRSARLASIIQRQMHRGLSEFAAAGWEPFDHGALTYPYYVLRDFDPPRLRRPTQMPAVLSEGMFLTNPRELRLLKRPMVRQRMAVAYYDAIAKYVASRSSHVGYRLVSGPASLASGEQGTYVIEVRNPGNTTMQRWRLRAGALEHPDMYEGRGRPGDSVGSSRIPRITPGKSKTVSVEVTAPARPGPWQLVFDARDRGGDHLSRLGAPALQVALTVTEPPPEPSPEASLDAGGETRRVLSPSATPGSG